MYQITLTKQELFDQAAKGLKAQGWQKSVVMKGSPLARPVCQYRGNDGLKCAIGHLLPDEVANACEGHGINVLVTKGMLTFADVNVQILANELQLAHDKSESQGDLYNMQKQFIHVALNHDINPKEAY